MLNISEKPLKVNIEEQYACFDRYRNARMRTDWVRVFQITLLVSVGVMFLPWTQTITGKGQLTTLKPEHRPQTIHSTIAGRVEKWYVREGQLVKKGDTIAFLSEIKPEYLDPELLKRTTEQIEAKSLSIVSYQNKVKALENQYQALKRNLTYKTEQTRNKLRQAHLKVTSDSIEFQAAKTAFDIADAQLKRQEQLYEKGLRSLTDLEGRRQKFQEALAKMISSENKLLVSRNELINASIELNTIRNEFADKMAKAGSDRYSAESDQYEASANVAKLRNQYANYLNRSGYYYITAPQNCYITKAITPGIGETVKEGQAIVSIMPAHFTPAVEMYIEPYDMPLVRYGGRVRVEFDGWPTIIFSGWPQLSFGTFAGKVVAIDNSLSMNGKFRVLVAEDGEEWPPLLRIGAGCNTLALLQDVPIWWETWRQINSFPPNYYEPSGGGKGTKSDKDAKDGSGK